jgi:tricorn protease
MAENIGDYAISSTGKRVLFEARGDVWSVPAGGAKGRPRNLTNTSGAAERNPTWSPDGKSVAYFSDATGENELYVAPSDGSGEARQLTSDSATYYFVPRWSPDSKKISFVERTGALWLVDVASAEKKLIHKGKWSTSPHWSWSHDSAWIAFSVARDTPQFWSLWLYNVATGDKTEATSGRFSDTWPTFDRKGEFLYLASQRDFSSPTYDDLGDTFVYNHTDRLYAIPLRKDVKSPFLAKDDYETWEDDAKEGRGEAEGDTER